jgi:serine/threonine protein kinase
MPESNRCPQCGTPLPAGALAGLCPACLLKLGASEDTVTDAKQGAFTPPSVAELAAKFPQLDILELIGKGGMGAVYKARQRQLDRIVALKILPPGIGDDPAFAERFAREAKALAKLNHPGIVTIYDFGRADGLFYFFMEFVDGVNLRQLLHAGRVSPREALAIVPQICDALQFAHDLGIVHRDIKPENILLDRRGRVKVADFGLVKIMGGQGDEPAADGLSAAGPTALTDAGKMMGTPQYMSPEQIQAPGAVDHRADIYALGVVFYQMLTGELPGKKLEPPSRKVSIDVRLDEIVMRALEKQPELRFQQASVLKTQVETIVSDSEKPETKTPQPETESRFSRLASIGAISAAVCLPALIAALAIHEKTSAAAPEVMQLFHNGTATQFSDSPVVQSWSFWFHLNRDLVTPLAIAGILGATILGWVAVLQIRRSSGKVYGMWLAVLDGLIFPLLVLDFFVIVVVGNIVPQSVGSETTTTIFTAVILGLGWLDYVIVRCVWRAVNQSLFGSTDKPQSGAPGQWALFFSGMAGVLGTVDFCFFTRNPPRVLDVLDWSILGLALAGIFTGIRARRHLIGKTAIAVGSVNLAIWLAVVIAVQFYPPSTPAPAAETAPAQTAAGNSAFGPVIERVVEPGNPARRALNLAFGNFAEPGPGRPLDFSTSGTNTLRAAGVDLYAPDNSSTGVLIWLDLRLCVGIYPQNADESKLTFDTITADHVRASLADMENWRTTEEATHAIPGVSLRNATGFIVGTNLHLFTTRNDVQGVLQITDVGENPRFVKVRYKLVQKSPGAETGGDILSAQPPVVVETYPVSGTSDVEPGEMEIRVRFNRPMLDGSWSWSPAWKNSAPEFIGNPHYDNDGRTWVVKVKLEPGKTYAFWLNSDKYLNFKDATGRPAVPYLLIFQTKQK